MKATRSLLLALALAAPAAHAADDVYRSVMPNGDVVYGESPYPGAKSSRKLPPPAAAGVVVATPEEQSYAKSLDKRTGGVSQIPGRKPQEGYSPAQAGSGSTYGTGPGPLPRRDY